MLGVAGWCPGLQRPPLADHVALVRAYDGICYVGIPLQIPGSVPDRLPLVAVRCFRALRAIKAF